MSIEKITDITQSITVDIIPNICIPPEVHVSKGDVGRKIIINLVNGGVLIGKKADTSAKIEMRMGEKNGLEFDAEYNADGSISFYLDSDMDSKAGNVYCKVRLIDSYGVSAASGAFIIVVDRSEE